MSLPPRFLLWTRRSHHPFTKGRSRGRRPAFLFDAHLVEIPGELVVCCAEREIEPRELLRYFAPPRGLLRLDVGFDAQTYQSCAFDILADLGDLEGETLAHLFP